jgi:hypothetical protein
MSCTFRVEGPDDGPGETLWTAPSSAARLFVGHSVLVAGLLEIPSGVNQVADDECVLDVSVFQTFCARAVARYERTNNGLLRTLLVGFLIIALVLLDRAGGAMPDSATAEQHASWVALRDQHAPLMPR